MSLADDLRAARALIDTPEKWRKDADGHDPHSCCAIVATNRALPRTEGLPQRNTMAWIALYGALPREWLEPLVTRSLRAQVHHISGRRACLR
jgi:hypothetical protein